MKTTIFVLSNIVFIFSCFSQLEVTQDTLSLAEGVQHKIIRCGASVATESEPLIIVDGVPMEWDSEAFQEISPTDISSVKILGESEAFACYGASAQNGVYIVSTNTNQISVKTDKELPFKIHEIQNENWTQIQDMYNAIRARVPGVSISRASSINVPKIRVRGQEETIVIVDGVRYDASILSVLNPADIEEVKVVNGVAASNYVINNQNQ